MKPTWNFLRSNILRSFGVWLNFTLFLWISTHFPNLPIFCYFFQLCRSHHVPWFFRSISSLFHLPCNFWWNAGQGILRDGIKTMVLLKIFMPFVRSLVHHDYDISPKIPLRSSSGSLLRDRIWSHKFWQVDFMAWCSTAFTSWRRGISGTCCSWISKRMGNYLESVAWSLRCSEGHPPKYELKRSALQIEKPSFRQSIGKVMSSGGSGSTQRQVHPPAACADSGEDPDEIFFWCDKWYNW